MTELSFHSNLNINQTNKKIRNLRTASKIVKTSELRAFDVIEMYKIYLPHHNVEFDDFYHRTLSQFNMIAIHRDKKKKNIVGFCGIREDVLKIHKKKMDIIYYGQMFLLEAYRGSNLMQKTSIYTFFKNKIFHPFRPLYYWGDCISYKSYLLLAKYYPIIYPHKDFKTPPKEQAVRDYLGKKYYLDSYQLGVGVILKETNRLKTETASISDSDLLDLHINFYSEVNPGYIKGDGLLTIIPGTYSNFIGNIKNYWKKKKTNPKKISRVKG